MKVLPFLALALTAAAVACSDPARPADQGTRRISVNLCSSLAPGVWFAYRNQDGPWTQVTPNSDGTIAFDATEKVSVASAFTVSSLTFTEIINATATELEGTASVSCRGDFGERTMGGTVTGLAPDEFARISAGSSLDGATQSDPSWLLEELPDHAVDLIATRYATASSQPAQRVVVRRGVTPATVAALDFTGPESAALESAVATFTGIPVGGAFTMISAVRTAGGTNHQLGDLTTAATTLASQAVGYVSLPASLRITTDMHVISASASNAATTQTIVHNYKTPGAKTLAFGPAIGEPEVSNVGTGSAVRPRVRLASQPSYPSALVADYGATVGQASRYISILTTAAFLGATPETWDVAVPDMSGAGFDPSWGLPTTSFSWSVSVYGTAGTSWPFGVQSSDGTTIVSSTRASSAGLARVHGFGRPSRSLTRPR